MKESSLRAFVRYYRYAAIGAYLLMFIHVVLLMFGIRLKVASSLTSLSAVPWFTALWLSHCLGFCLAHKMCLVYVLVISSCIRFQETGPGFGELLPVAHITMLILGTAILVWLIRRRICRNLTKNRQ